MEQLHGEDYKKAEPLIPILTEEFCKMMFSKQWPAREESLKWLENQINRPTEVSNNDFQVLFISCFGAISYTLVDKVAAVQVRSLSVLQALLAKHSKIKVLRKGEYIEYLDNTIQGVIEKLGDTNPKVKDEAEKSIKMLADHPSVGPLIVVQHIIKGFLSKPKLEQSIRHMNGRLFVLHELIKTFQINNPNMPYQPIVDFTLK